MYFITNFTKRLAFVLMLLSCMSVCAPPQPTPTEICTDVTVYIYQPFLFLPLYASPTPVPVTESPSSSSSSAVGFPVSTFSSKFTQNRFATSLKRLMNHANFDAMKHALAYFDARYFVINVANTVSDLITVTAETFAELYDTHWMRIGTELGMTFQALLPPADELPSAKPVFLLPAPYASATLPEPYHRPAQSTARFSASPTSGYAAITDATANTYYHYQDITQLIRGSVVSPQSRTAIHYQRSLWVLATLASLIYASHLHGFSLPLITRFIRNFYHLYFHSKNDKEDLIARLLAVKYGKQNSWVVEHTVAARETNTRPTSTIIEKKPKQPMELIIIPKKYWLVNLPQNIEIYPPAAIQDTAAFENQNNDKTNNNANLGDTEVDEKITELESQPVTTAINIPATLQEPTEQQLLYDNVENTDSNPETAPATTTTTTATTSKPAVELIEPIDLESSCSASDSENELPLKVVKTRESASSSDAVTRVISQSSCESVVTRASTPGSILRKRKARYGSLDLHSILPVKESIGMASMARTHRRTSKGLDLRFACPINHASDSKKSPEQTTSEPDKHDDEIECIQKSIPSDQEFVSTSNASESTENAENIKETVKKSILTPIPLTTTKPPDFYEPLVTYFMRDVTDFDISDFENLFDDCGLLPLPEQPSRVDDTLGNATYIQQNLPLVLQYSTLVSWCFSAFQDILGGLDVLESLEIRYVEKNEWKVPRIKQRIENFEMDFSEEVNKKIGTTFQNLVSESKKFSELLGGRKKLHLYERMKYHSRTSTTSQKIETFITERLQLKKELLTMAKQIISDYHEHANIMRGKVHCSNKLLDIYLKDINSRPE